MYYYIKESKKETGFENYLKDVKYFNKKSTNYNFCGIRQTEKDIIDIKVSDYGFCFFCLNRDLEIDVYRKRRIRNMNNNDALDFVVRVTIPGVVSFNINPYSCELLVNSVIKQKISEGGLLFEAMFRKSQSQGFTIL